MGGRGSASKAPAPTPAKPLTAKERRGEAKARLREMLARATSPWKERQEKLKDKLAGIQASKNADNAAKNREDSED